MSCDICGRGSCTQSFHSLEVQEQFEIVIALFEKARELREQIQAEEQDADEEND